MPRNQYDTMNLLIASTKSALVDKLNGGSDRIVSTLNAVYSIETSHPRSFHRTKEWWHGLHNVEGRVRANLKTVASSASKPRLHHLHPTGLLKLRLLPLYHSVLQFLLLTLSFL